METELGSSIFFNDLCFEEKEPEIDMVDKERFDQQIEEYSEQQDEVEYQIWKMNFYGSSYREGAVDGVWINHPKGDSNLCSYKLVFECTNNMEEYGALVLGLKVLKELGARRIVFHGYCEIIINKIKGIYQEKQPRLRAYRNLVLDLLEKFPEYNLSAIPREKNQIVDALTTSTTVFKVPIFPGKKYKVEVKYKPVVPINIKYWKVFEDAK
jgi:ribonuclease HI